MSMRSLRPRLMMLIGLGIVGSFACLQFRSWRLFDWHTFWIQTSQAKVAPLVAGVLLIYISYLVLAMRWRLLLNPLRRSTVTRLFYPTAIGFTGLVLLGRPGELIRPYLIAKSEHVSFPSQVVAWFIERLFDMFACALLISVAFLAGPSFDSSTYFGRLRTATLILVLTTLGVSALALLLRANAQVLASWLRAASRRTARRFDSRAAEEIEVFLGDLFRIRSLAKVAGLSLLLWLLNGIACWAVITAYPDPLRHFQLGGAFEVMGFGILGSLVQLPAVGGGSQLATVGALVHVFHVPKELAVSCGVSLWLVMFASIVPFGLAIAHRKGLSLRKLSQEGTAADTAARQSKDAVPLLNRA